MEPNTVATHKTTFDLVHTENVTMGVVNIFCNSPYLYNNFFLKFRDFVIYLNIIILSYIVISDMTIYKFLEIKKLFFFFLFIDLIWEFAIQEMKLKILMN